MNINSGSSIGFKWMLQEVLRKGGLESSQDEYVHDVLKSNDRMISLVNDLLNISRLETGTIKAVSKRTELIAFLDELVKEARLLAADTKQTVEFIKPDSKIYVVIDPQLIGQVVTNLLSNAIYYTDGGKKITMTVKKSAKNFSISVQDEGMGISEEERKRLFTKFFRSREAAKRSTTGSGLGLYIVEKILEVCSGTIDCVSEEKKGATFTVTLPVKGPVNKESEKNLIPKKFAPLIK